MDTSKKFDPLMDSNKRTSPPQEVSTTVSTEDDSSSSTTEDSKSASKQPPTITTAFSTDSSTEEAKNEEARLIRLFRDTLEYIVVSEETQRSPKCFTREFGGKEDSSSSTHEGEPNGFKVHWLDWTRNHYFAQKNQEETKRDKSQVFLASYDYVPDPRDIVTSATNDSTNRCWLKIRRPFGPSKAKPRIGDNVDVGRYLEHLLEDLYPDDFPGASMDTLEAMIPLLREKHMPEASPGMEQIREFVFSAIGYNKGSNPTTPAMRSCYENLYKYNKKPGGKELLVGFGHVRTIYKAPTSNKKRTMINGPLFEVPVELKFQDGVGGLTELWISPAQNAKIYLNAEIMSILNAIGGKTSLMRRFNSLAAEIKVTDLRLDDPWAYHSLLQAATTLCAGGKFDSASSQTVHREPDKADDLHVSDAWCLFAREVASTIASLDARQMIRDLDKGVLALSPPIRALMSGPNYLNADNSAARVEGVKKEDLFYALPTSRQQRDVGERLFVRGEPVMTLEGPPGTGKTHSNVNIACTGLSVGKSVLMTSSNEGALKAFVDKMPRRLQEVVLDMTLCKHEDFHKKLNKFVDDIRERFGAGHSGNMEYVGKILKARSAEKKEFRDVFGIMESSSELKRGIFENNDVVVALDAVLGFPSVEKGRLMAMAVIKGDTGLDFKEILDGLKSNISFGEDENGIDSKVMFETVKERASQPIKFKPTDLMSEIEKKLESVKVDGRRARNQNDWKEVLKHLEFRMKWISSLRLQGFCNGDAVGEEKSSLIDLFDAGLELKEAISDLHEGERKVLRSIFESDVSSDRKKHEKCRKLLTDIQIKDTELLYDKVVASLRKKLDHEAVSRLTRLCDIIEKMNSEVSVQSERSIRYNEDFKSVFRDVLKFMPLVVMTTDQVSEMVSPDHSFDLVIIDETSQSSCTAITVMARCKQMLAVGDEKQVSPSAVGLSEVHIRLLEEKLPEIDTKKALMPESSFFHLFKAAFTGNSVMLKEHYRCDPRIIAVCNEFFYDSRLLPLRLPARGTEAITNKMVGGSLDRGRKKEKTNPKEAEEIVKWIHDYIEECCKKDDGTHQTIGVISLSGLGQHNLIKEMYEEKVLHPLGDRFGRDRVNRHNVLIGTPQIFQGNERDIVLCSTVDVPPTTGKQKLKQDASAKAWNVALSRPRNQLIVFRSYGLKHLDGGDFRQRVLRYIIEERPPHSKPCPEFWKRPALVGKTEHAMAESLQSHGYTVEKQDEKVWSRSFRVLDSGGSCALVLVENGGETEEEWIQAEDQQKSLQRTGRNCLRVDCLSLALRFDEVVQDILCFLSECGMSPSSTATSSQHGDNNNSSKRSSSGVASSASGSATKKSRSN